MVELQLLAGDPNGPGNLDGVGTAARFSEPQDVAVDGAGNVYVADEANALIRKITVAGVVTTSAGAKSPGSDDGAGAAACLRPSGVVVDEAGNLYVADPLNHTIHKITDTGVVTTLAGATGVSGSEDGAGATARFLLPADVAVDGCRCRRKRLCRRRQQPRRPQGHARRRGHHTCRRDRRSWHR